MKFENNQWLLTPEEESELIKYLSRQVDKLIIEEMFKVKGPESLEDKIKKYDDMHYSELDLSYAQNGIANSIQFRIEKIIRDHCE